MKARKFLEIFRKAIQEIYKKPTVFIVSAIFFAFIFSISLVGKKIAPFLQGSMSNVIWLTASLIILLGGGAFLLGGLLDLIKPKKNSRGFFYSGKQFWLRNFFILIMLWLLMLIGNGILFLFTRAMISFSPSFTISELAFKIIAFLIYFFWLIFFVIFFSFTNCYCVLHDLQLKQSIRRSFSLVKREYPATLSLWMVLFVLTFILNKIQGLFGDIILYVLVIPLSIAILTMFVALSEENK